MAGQTVYAAQPLDRPAPDWNGSQWINTDPLTTEDLEGRVVLVEFWTFGCYNCVNVEPYIKNWYARYRSKGLTVIAIHSPEFDYERNPENVRRYVKENGIEYPVLIDNDFANWRAFENQAWPAIYLIDRKGKLRYRHVGEGAYKQTDAVIRQLLRE